MSSLLSAEKKSLAVAAVALVGFILIAPFAAFAQNRGASGALIESTPYKSAWNAAESVWFEELPPEETGVNLVHRFPEGPQYLALMQDHNSGGGVAIGDYDDDSYPDIFITNYHKGNRLYRNLRNWNFEDVTAEAGLDRKGAWSTGPTFVDIDNDGDLDLYVCVTAGSNLLYINDGKGRFTERAQAFGLDFSGASVSMTFADYDRDGLLDAYLLTNRLCIGTDHVVPNTHAAVMERKIIEVDEDGRPAISDTHEELFGMLSMRQPDGRLRTVITKAGQADYLYRNNGDGTFTDVSKDAGITGYDVGLAANWWDYNNDTYPDLYVSNDFETPDRLYRNNGDGTFTDVTSDTLPHVPWTSMGADFADINNDGLMDFFATDMAATTHFKSKLYMGDMGGVIDYLAIQDVQQYMRNALFINTGTERMLEAAQMAGVSNTDWTWGVKFADFDNDGLEDLYVPNGMVREFMNADVQAVSDSHPLGSLGAWLELPVMKEMNRAYRNRGDLTFEDVSEKWGLGKMAASYASAVGDLDADGDLDLVVTNTDDAVSMYRNDSPKGNSIQVTLRGTESNRHGWGATVRVEAGGVKMMRYHNPVRGLMASNEPIVHFGLGEAEQADVLTVTWPSGIVQRFEDLEANQRYTITEGAQEGVEPAVPESAKPLFRTAANGPEIVHEEIPYDDFARQPLLPNRLSALGPGMAMGDVSGDGIDDLYIAGSAGYLGMLYFGEEGGNYTRAPFPALPKEAIDTVRKIARAEEMGVVFLDSDGDGDLDLYTAAGGVECEPGDAVLQDWLYINDGAGNFKPDPAKVPEIHASSSVAAAADFDRDGDLDLYVGSRSIPGQYPLAPESHLLVNDGGVFHVAGEDIAPGVAKTGLVTSALWSDVDGDGWLDLLVTHEWGPVKYFRNEEGILRDKTEGSGLDALPGWWNGISGGDVDGDGDIDYLVTNFGHNTKYHVSPDKPVMGYYSDFEAEGEFHFVEAKYADGEILPIRGRSCSSRAMPILAERFPTFEKFAKASLPEIYTPECLEEAYRVEVRTLDNGVFLNNGAGEFRFVPLPELAQIAPGFGAVITEVNGDGRPDAYIVQNFFGPQVETGRMDGGVSQLLLGAGDGAFTPVWPAESGLVLPGDAMSLVLNDVNNDGLPDFIAGLNSGPVRTFTHCGEPEQPIAKVRLAGGAGNANAYGARVTFKPEGGVPQTAEVYGGGGYLSQSAPVLFFGMGDAGTAQVTVRWPDGATSTEQVDRGNAKGVVIAYPQ